MYDCTHLLVALGGRTCAQTQNQPSPDHTRLGTQVLWLQVLLKSSCQRGILCNLTTKLGRVCERKGGVFLVMSTPQ